MLALFWGEKKGTGKMFSADLFFFKFSSLRVKTEVHANIPI